MYTSVKIKKGGEHVAEKKTSEAQLRAIKRWKEKNPERVKYLRYKSQAKKFVREIASAEDIEEMQDYINERKQ